VTLDIGQQKKVAHLIEKVQKWEYNVNKKEKDDPFSFITEEFERATRRGDLLNDPTLNAIDGRYAWLISAWELTGKAKCKGVMEFMATLLENNLKFLVFAHHFEVLDALEDFVQR
jgi:hypothetical protein